MISLILLIFAFVLCALAAIPKAQASTAIALGWAGMACYFLSLLVGRM